MSKLRTISVIAVILIATLIAITILTNQQPDSPDNELDTPVKPKPEPKPEPVVTRESKLPDDLVKQTPDSDISPPVMHSFLWEDPVPLTGTVNTVGGEDSAFIMPDGETLYFFFTPDVRKPAEQQILDDVTGIWVAKKQGGEWGDVERVKLIDKGISLDGAQFVNEEEIWFASVRLGNYNEIDYYIADIVDGEYVNVRNAEELNTEIQVGELHLTSDRQTLYFHSYREGGKGDMDIWMIEREGDGWSEPVNVENINSDVLDGYPYVSEDMTELWLTRWHMGTPAIFKSIKNGDDWSEPQLIVSTFAGESTLDNEGNLLFTHHFYKDSVMLEADIYVAYRKQARAQVKEALELEDAIIKTKVILETLRRKELEVRGIIDAHKFLALSTLEETDIATQKSMMVVTDTAKKNICQVQEQSTKSIQCVEQSSINAINNTKTEAESSIKKLENQTSRIFTNNYYHLMGATESIKADIAEWGDIKEEAGRYAAEIQIAKALLGIQDDEKVILEIPPLIVARLMDRVDYYIQNKYPAVLTRAPDAIAGQTHAISTTWEANIVTVSAWLRYAILKETEKR